MTAIETEMPALDLELLGSPQIRLENQPKIISASTRRKALLICPNQRIEVSGLSETMPLSNIPVFGKSLIEIWLEHLVMLGAKEILVLATDRPEQVRTLIGSGRRWGLNIEVIPQLRELTPAEARFKYRVTEKNGWLAAPYDASLMEHLPALPEYPLFNSYANFFKALRTWLPHAATPNRIGVHEIKPGVWIGMHTRIASDADLRAPCWIGDNVVIGKGATIGPMAFLERAAFVESEAEISESIVGPETLVGKATEVSHSIAWGNALLNWKSNSCIKIPDAFLLCDLSRRASAFKPVGLFSRLAALVTILLTLPVVLIATLILKLRGKTVLRPLLAVRPCPGNLVPLPGHTLIYYEMAIGGWRRWPQLWSIVCGDFAWIGNRPLNPDEAAQLTSDFERLWLAASPGFISLADVEGCHDFWRAETQAHASFYAAQMNRRMDVAIFLRALFIFVCGIPYSTALEFISRLRLHQKIKERH